MEAVSKLMCAIGKVAAGRIRVLMSVAVIVYPFHAAAQESADEDVSPNVSVSDRFANNFEVDGVKVGGFTLFPSAAYTQVYSDNIFSAQDNQVDDFIANLSGAMRLRSDWSLNGVELYGNTLRREYFDNSTESTTDYTIGGSAYLQPVRRGRITASGSYFRGAEARRETQTATGGAEPVRFDRTNAALTFDFRQTRAREQFGVSYLREDFDDVQLAGLAPIVLDQDFRDRDVYSAFYRQSFRIRPTVALFAQVNGEIQEFDNPQPFLNARQDSESYGISGGVVFDINKVARGEIGVGYANRDFDDPIFTDISGLNVEASVEYFLSDLTTIVLSAERRIQASAVVGVAGNYANSAELYIEHELFRPIMLFARARYRLDEFSGIDREDEVTGLSGGVIYAFRRNVVMRAEYRYLDVSSSGAARRLGFHENNFRIGIELRL